MYLESLDGDGMSNQGERDAAMESAIKAMDAASPVSGLPTGTWEYVKLKQLYSMAKASLQAAEFAEYAASQSRLRAQGLLKELRVRLDHMEDDLGLDTIGSEDV